MSMWCRSGAQVAGFLGSFGRTPVLTKQQESGLTHIIRRGNLLEQRHSAMEEELGRKPTEEELREGACGDPPFLLTWPCRLEDPPPLLPPGTNRST